MLQQHMINTPLTLNVLVNYSALSLLLVIGGDMSGGLFFKCFYSKPVILSVQISRGKPKHIIYR